MRRATWVGIRLYIILVVIHVFCEHTRIYQSSQRATTRMRMQPSGSSLCNARLDTSRALKDRRSCCRRYWHDCNDYSLQLNGHIQERDAVLNQIDRANQRLQVR